ncbi:NAD(P)/FAD-dependent oxidoreductase [Streptosporangium sandarakinum]
MGLRVIIAGGGIGGLCLAQGLRKRGVSVEVFESEHDLGPWQRGFRLRVDRSGRGALVSCLPARLYDLAQATAGRLYTPRGAVYDHLLNEVVTARPPDLPLDPAAAAMVVDRRTLREILFTGLGDAVRFGQPVVDYEHVGDQVRVLLADGGSATGDVLVAADGVGSAVRRRRLPQAEVLDLDLSGVYGHLPLDDEALAWIPAELLGGARPVLSPEGWTMVLGAFQPQMPTADALAQTAPGTALQPVPAYLQWTLLAPAEAHPLPPEALRAAAPAELYGLAAEATRAWHPLLRRIIAESRPETTTALAIQTMIPTPAWPSDNVTVLGDCIHAMTPVGGLGANAALRDAALLAAALADADAGRRGLISAISHYEAQMRDYAYEAISSSLWGAETLFGTRTPSTEGAHA